MTAHKQHAPKLRFPEFTEPWEMAVLGDIASFSKGKGISKSDIDPNGQTYCVRYGELYTTYDTIIDEPVSKTSAKPEGLVLSEGGEVIVPASGETAEDIATAAVVLREGVALGSDLNIIRSDLNGLFLAPYLSGKKRMTLAAMAQGNSVVHLYPAQLKLLPLGIPSSGEQGKVSAFLQCVNEKISLLEEKAQSIREFKIGCMEQLFSRRIRFKDSNGGDFPAWRHAPLGHVATIIGGGTPDSKVSEFWEGDIQWFTPTEIKSKYLSKSVRTITKSGLKNSSAKLLPIGSLLLSTRATVGDVGIAQRECCTNQGFQSLVMKGNNYNEFWYYWILQNRNEFLRRASGSTFLEIGKSEISKIPTMCPSPEEQRRIADFLSSIDTKLAHVTEELELAQTFKIGLLQQMFI